MKAKHTWKQRYNHTKIMCFCRPDVHFQWGRLHLPISLHPIFREKLRKLFHWILALHKKWSFPLRISSVNVNESAVNCEFGHIYWRNPSWKTSFLCSVNCFKRQNLLTKSQSIFLPSDSCISQLLSITHEMHEMFGCNQPVSVRETFLDILKAFNKISIQ